MIKNLRKIFRKISRFFLYIVAPEKESVKKLAGMESRDIARILPAAGPIVCLRDRAPNLSALFAYKDRRVKELVWEIKYRKNSALAERIGVLLYEKMLAQAQTENLREVILAPIPTSGVRRKERGFNQCEVICEAVMKNFQKDKKVREIFSYEPNALAKIKNTPHQADLARDERLTNVAGSFAVPHPEKVRDKIIFIVDDVITTGQTITEAETALMGAGVKSVYGFSIAH